MTAISAPAAGASMRIERKVLTTGLGIGGMTIFAGMIGMLVAFDDRNVIDPILSMGYALALGIFVIGGHRAVAREELEGVEFEPYGMSDVASGAIAGLIGGVLVGLFAFFIDAVDVREVLNNVSPALHDFLTFDSGSGVGLLVLAAGGAGLGAVGAATHLLSQRVREAAISGTIWVFIIGFIELVLVDIVESFALEDLIEDLIYGARRGLTIPAAVVVFGGVFFLTYRFRGRVSGFRERFQVMPEEQRRKTGIVLALVFIALGAILPAFFGTFLNELLTIVGLFLLMGLGLNIVVGLAGILDLGYVAFFAVGAYATAVLTSPLSPAVTPELTWFAALPFVVVFAAMAGVLVGTPVLRMRGDYLAIVTLGFGEIARILFLSDWFKGVFGGAQGIIQIPSVELGPITIKGTDPQQVFYLILFFVIIVAYVSWRLQDSRIGRAWIAMREDEHVAEAMGVNTVTAKLLAFVIGAIMASFGGAIFAAKIGSIFPNSFQLLVSLIVLVLIIVGGMGNIPGVAVGAFVLVGVLGGPTSPGLLREFEEFKLLIYGTLLVYMMLKRPEGLLPSARRTRELHQDEYLQDAWIEAQDKAVEPGGSG
jgi:branched-chain amino acid transport system permease protein